MGILNLTPDSFSELVRFSNIDEAVDRALEIEAEGADLIDIGGESTRPGARPVSVDEELSRVMPVIEKLQGRLRIPISIDTTKKEVAEAAINGGAEIINDISGLRFDPGMADVAAKYGAGLIVMHSRGTPQTMQTISPVEDILTEVAGGLKQAVEEAGRRGVDRQKLIIDPGIGFGKTPMQNLQLINHLDQLISEIDLPLLLGSSRKSFIGRSLDHALTDSKRDERRERVAGTAASVALGILKGARIVRVHDVLDMVAVARLTEAISTV